MRSVLVLLVWLLMSAMEVLSYWLFLTTGFILMFNLNFNVYEKENLYIFIS